ncbi:ferredoxin, partial [Actinosynnema sp. NPDC049800]
MGGPRDRARRLSPPAWAAPDVFDQRDEDGVVVLLDPEPAEHLHAAVR